MSKLTKALTAAAGNAGGGALYAEDVFSTYLYDGNGSTQIITNGIDLDGEGGLTWIKARDIGYSHQLFDTERGATKQLYSNTTNGETTAATSLTSFNSDGFSLGALNGVNNASQTFASWTFRKAEKFFDVVTYTGNSSGVTVNHNLNSDVGFIVVKRTDSTSGWTCWHRNDGSNYLRLSLESTLGAFSASGKWGTVDSSSFSMVSGATDTGGTYVAYLFASDAGGFGDDGSESIIKCGSYTADGSGNVSIDLGFEPQFVISKRTDSTGSWEIADSMRGFYADGGANSINLSANLSNSEGSNKLKITSTGFTDNNAALPNSSHIYIAIRRPMKTPESGTEVFKTIEQNWSTGILDAGFPVDLAIFQQTAAGNNGRAVDRLRGKTQVLNPNDTFAEGGEPYYALDNNEGFELVSSPVSNNWVWWMFKRATGFFDVVAYTGDGQTTQTLNHNLGVTPDIIVVKKRSTSGSQWPIIITSTTDTMYLNTTNASFGAFYYIDNPTSTTFDVQTDGSAPQSNQSGETYIAYLFATLAGVSKVGSYTGTGSNVDVDCGFSAGARFILIKRTDSTGDWYVWDSVRGIVAGNDPYLLLNSTAAEVTSTDYIDPLASGFTVTSSAPAALNASGGNYIFLAIS